MARTLVDEIIIPAEHGRAFRVYQAQTMRVIAVDGPQVGDMVVFNAHDYRQTYDGFFSYMANFRMGTGNTFKLKYLYSRLPKGDLMMEVTEDKVGRHFISNPGMCNPAFNKILGLPETARSCWGNLAEAISEFGMSSDRVPAVFNLWMNVEFDENHVHNVLPTLAKQGDYTDFFAHMHLLVAISACPGNQNNITQINGGRNKPLKVEIWEGSD